jgi:hypothetical protein
VPRIQGYPGAATVLPQTLQTKLRCRVFATWYGVCSRHFEIEPSAGKCVRMVRLLAQNATGLSQSLILPCLFLSPMSSWPFSLGTSFQIEQVSADAETAVVTRRNGIAAKLLFATKSLRR